MLLRFVLCRAWTVFLVLSSLFLSCSGLTCLVMFSVFSWLRRFAPGLVKKATDYATEMVRAARRTLPPHVSVQEASADRLPFGDATFDRYVANLCLMLVPSFDEAVTEAVRVLRSGFFVLCCLSCCLELVVLCCLVLCCLVLCCLVLSCLVLPCLVISCFRDVFTRRGLC